MNEALRMLFGGEVDESPVLQECVDPHDTADISWEVLAAKGGRKILLRVFFPQGINGVSIDFI